MKIIILKSNLKRALQAVERSITDNANLPILSNILLTAEKKVFIRATNLEIGVTHIAAAKISEAGTVTIPFGTLNTIISNTTSERITISTEGDMVVVNTDNYEAKIQGVSSEDFPIIPEIESTDNSISISAENLKEALSLVVSASGTSDLKPELSSVLFRYEAGVIKFVATDGFRLAEKTLLNNSFKTNYTTGFSVLIPLKTALEVIRVFSEEDEVSIFVDDHQILFESIATKIISRLVDGQYPDYEKIVPQQTSAEFLFDRKEFLAGVKLVSSFSGKTSDIRLKFSENGKSLEVYAANQNLGENSYIIPVKKQKDGAVGNIVFNWRYLVEGIKPFGSEMIRLGVVSETKPIIVRPADDDSIYYIVMPIQE